MKFNKNQRVRAFGQNGVITATRKFEKGATTRVPIFGPGDPKEKRKQIKQGEFLVDGKSLETPRPCGQRRPYDEYSILFDNGSKARRVQERNIEAV